MQHMLNVCRQLMLLVRRQRCGSCSEKAPFTNRGLVSWLPMPLADFLCHEGKPRQCHCGTCLLVKIYKTTRILQSA